MDNRKYLIYQLKDDRTAYGFHSESLEQPTKAGRTVDWENYKHMYTGELSAEKKPAAVELEQIISKINRHCPEDFKGHPLSNGDVVVLCSNGKAAAYYINGAGYIEAPEFLNAPFKYYSTQRPVDIGTFPKTENGPVHIVNFDKREYVENASFRAWGFLAYDAPLTVKQLENYELRPVSGNPDNIMVSPYQLEAQLDVIGKWEKAKRIADVERITWYHSDFGCNVKKDWVKAEQITTLYNEIVEAKTRDAERRSSTVPKRIAEQLDEAEKQVQFGAATSVAKQNKSHEDR